MDWLGRRLGIPYQGGKPPGGREGEAASAVVSAVASPATVRGPMGGGQAIPYPEGAAPETPLEARRAPPPAVIEFVLPSRMGKPAAAVTATASAASAAAANPRGGSPLAPALAPNTGAGRAVGETTAAPDAARARLASPQPGTMSTPAPTPAPAAPVKQEPPRTVVKQLVARLSLEDASHGRHAAQVLLMTEWAKVAWAFTPDVFAEYAQSDRSGVLIFTRVVVSVFEDSSHVAAAATLSALVGLVAHCGSTDSMAVGKTLVQHDFVAAYLVKLAGCTDAALVGATVTSLTPWFKVIEGRLRRHSEINNAEAWRRVMPALVVMHCEWLTPVFGVLRTICQTQSQPFGAGESVNTYIADLTGIWDAILAQGAGTTGILLFSLILEAIQRSGALKAEFLRQFHAVGGSEKVCDLAVVVTHHVVRTRLRADETDPLFAPDSTAWSCPEPLAASRSGSHRRSPSSGSAIVRPAPPSSARVQAIQTLLRTEESLMLFWTFVEEFLYLGDAAALPEGPAQVSPYQFPEFRMPVPTANPLAANDRLLKAMLHGYEARQRHLACGALAAREASEGSDPAPAPEKRVVVDESLLPPVVSELVSVGITQTLFRVIQSNPINFFLGEAHRLLLTLVQHMEFQGGAVQGVVMEMVTYALTTLKYFPFREIASACSLFEGKSDKQSLSIVCATFLDFLESIPHMHTAMREVGLLDILGRDLIMIQTDGVHQFPALLASFDDVMHLVSVLVEDPENAAVFRLVSKDAMFALLHQSKLRPGLMRVIHKLASDHLENLSKALQHQSLAVAEDGSAPYYAEIQSLIVALQRSEKHDLGLKLDIHMLLMQLLPTSVQAQAYFLQCHGIDALLDGLQALDAAFVPGMSDGDRSALEALLKSTFKLMLAAIESPEKARFVASLEIPRVQALFKTSGIMESSSASVAFACLLGCAIGKPQVIDTFTGPSDASPTASVEQLAATPSLEATLHLGAGPSAGTGGGSSPTTVEAVRSQARRNARRAAQHFAGKKVHHPIMIAAILDVLPAAREQLVLVHSILAVLNALISPYHKFNIVRANQFDVQNALLSWMLTPTRWWTPDAIVAGVPSWAPFVEYQAQHLLASLLEVGLSDKNLHHIMAQACLEIPESEAQQLAAYDLILEGVERGNSPNYLHFDHAITTRAAIVLGDYGRPFPPMNGYTLTTWIRVDRFADDFAIPIMTVLDDENAVRLAVTLTPTQIKLHTYKQSVAFTVDFATQAWHHIVITHQKPRLTNSTANLYLDGQLVHHVKCGYLGHPGSATRTRTVLGHLPSSSEFLHLCAWNLGPTHFVEEVVLDAGEVSAIHSVGPQYKGLFQGDLAKLQNQHLMDVLSQLTAIKAKPSNLPTIGEMLARSNTLTQRAADKSVSLVAIPEDKILFSMIPDLELGNLRLKHRNEAGNSVAAWTAGIGVTGHMLLNGAPAKLRPEAGSRLNLLQIRGDVTTMITSHTAEGIHKIGGSAVLIGLVSNANTSHSLFKAVSILATCVNNDWRLREEMEREHFYEILAQILKSRKHLMTVAIVDVLMTMIGRSVDNIPHALITNSAAFIQIFLDFDLWQARQEIQQCWFAVMYDLVSHSKFADENLSRLFQISIIKRLITFIKLQVFHKALIPEFINLLKICCKFQFNLETIRTLCTFLVSTLPTSPRAGDKSQRSRVLPPSTPAATTTATTATTTAADPAAALSPQQSSSPTVSAVGNPHGSAARSSMSLSARAVWMTQMRIYILAMLHDILQEPNSKYVSIFAQTVSPRWILLFCNSALDEVTTTLAVRMFARLWVETEASITGSFNDGYTILVSNIRTHFDLPAIYKSLMSLAFGTDPVGIPFDGPISVSGLLAMFRPDLTPGRRRRAKFPDATRALLSLAKTGIEFLSRDRTLPSPPASDIMDLTIPSKSNSNSESILAGWDPRAQPYSPMELAQFLEIFFTFLTEGYIGNEDMREAMQNPMFVEDLMEIVMLVMLDQHPKHADFELKLWENERTADAEPAPSGARLVAEMSANSDLDDREGWIQMSGIDSPALHRSRVPSAEDIAGAYPASSDVPDVHVAHAHDTMGGGPLDMRPGARSGMPLPDTHPMLSVQESLASIPLIGLGSLASGSMHGGKAPSDGATTAVPTASAPSGDIADLQVSGPKTPNVWDVLQQVVSKLIVAICLESVLSTSKPFVCFETVLRSIPPTHPRIQKRLTEDLWARLFPMVINVLQRQKGLYQDAKVRSNLLRLCTLINDALYVGLVESTITSDAFEFILTLVEMITNADNERWMNESVTQAILKQMNRCALANIGFITAVTSSTGQTAKPSLPDDQLLVVLTKMVFYQKVLFSAYNNDSEFYRLIISQLFECLSSNNAAVRTACINVFKCLILQRPQHVTAVLKNSRGVDQPELINGFSKILEMDISAFLSWFNSKNVELGGLIYENTNRFIAQFNQLELRAGRETQRQHRLRRIGRLRRLSQMHAEQEDLLARYGKETNDWIANIKDAELESLRKLSNDYEASQVLISADWKMCRDRLAQEQGLRRALHADPAGERWKLDFMEGKARMRKRLRRNADPHIAYLNKTEQVEHSASRLLMESAAMATSTSTTPATVSAGAFHRDASVVSASGGAPITPHDGLDASKPSDHRLSETPATVAHDAADAAGNLMSADATSLGDLSREDGLGPDGISLLDQPNRRLARLLGTESKYEAHNIARVVGLDLFEGVMIVTKDKVIIIDNYFRRENGELVDVDHMPATERNMLHTLLLEQNRSNDKSSPLFQEMSEHDKFASRQFGILDIREVHKRTFLFRDVAFEVFLADGRSCLLSFATTKVRDSVYYHLNQSVNITGSESVAGIAARNPMMNVVGTDYGGKLLSNVVMNLTGSGLDELTQKWLHREISNFTYLMHLNTLAGRSYNDVTQYPVFPWVIADWTSAELDLTNPASFRDLSKPMGAQDPTRLEKFVSRFKTWEDPSLPACHYGTHYSSAMIVCSYLIRMEPFTRQYLQLQGGHFDHPDRLFHSMQYAYESAAKLNTTDVKELIPEFFYLPEFLVNSNHFNFGTKQTGDVINDIVLPPWAHDNPRTFIEKHREALECDYVSERLHLWIDLIFGYKQQGQEAIDAANVFHWLSYEGAVDLDKMDDPLEKQATVGIIYNFGQTPRHLFKRPHPGRTARKAEAGFSQGRLWEHPEALVRSSQPVAHIGSAVGEIRVNREGVVAVDGSKALHPPNFHKVADWDYLDHSCRMVVLEHNRCLAVIEGMHAGRIVCGIWVDGDLFISGGSDRIITIWRYTHGRKPTFKPLAVLRAHAGKVLALAASRSFNLLVSGDEHGDMGVWDLNRRELSRKLPPMHGGIACMAVNDNTGDFLAVCDDQVNVYSINGDLLAAVQLTVPPIVPVSGSTVAAAAAAAATAAAAGAAPVAGGLITACVFCEGAASEVFDFGLIVIGTRRGDIHFLRKVGVQTPARAATAEEPEAPTAGESLLMHNLPAHYDTAIVKTLASFTSGGVVAAITHLMVPASQRYLLSGDSQGRVYAWVMPDGSSTEVHHITSDACQFCKTPFAVLERRSNCRCCGAQFCATCLFPGVDPRLGRLCQPCSNAIAKSLL